MQGIRYEYKLIIAYMSDTAEYKLYKYINLEDNSIKEFWVLQSEEEQNPYRTLLGNLGNPKKSYFT
jgi:hypothetical protein